MIQKTAQKGFLGAPTVFLIAFLLAVIALAFFVIDPIDRIRASSDEKLAKESEKLATAIREYFLFSGRMPWKDDFGASVSSPALSWTYAGQAEIGVCGTNCSSGGELMQDYTVPIPGSRKTKIKRFLDENYLKVFNENKLGESLLVGKDQNPQNPIYICFLPQSQKIRKASGSLYKIEPAGKLNGKPEGCPDTVTWKEEDVCWKCTAK